jgi:4-carboxymuconolactone decarboxylase
MKRINAVNPGTRPELRATEEKVLASRGKITPLYQVLLNSPAICEGWEQLMTAVRYKTSLSDRLRELIILRIAVLNDAPYEFNAHAPLAEKAGVTAAEIEAVRQTPPGPALSEHALRVLALTDAMTREVHVSDVLFEHVTRGMSDTEKVEIAATIASYNMVSRFLVGLHVE